MLQGNPDIHRTYDNLANFSQHPACSTEVGDNPSQSGLNIITNIAIYHQLSVNYCIVRQLFVSYRVTV
jgi:hypothetical protein